MLFKSPGYLAPRSRAPLEVQSQTIANTSKGMWMKWGCSTGMFSLSLVQKMLYFLFTPGNIYNAELNCSVYWGPLVLLDCKLFEETNNGKVYYNILQTSHRTSQLNIITVYICYCRLLLKDSNCLCFTTKRHFICQFPPFLPDAIPYTKA